jgi:hypothetical protein
MQSWHRAHEADIPSVDLYIKKEARTRTPIAVEVEVPLETGGTYRPQVEGHHAAYRVVHATWIAARLLAYESQRGSGVDDAS